MAYEKLSMQAVGASLADVIFAVMDDGVGVEDAPALISFLTAAVGQAGEIKDDPDAAILDIVSGLTSSFADKRRNDQFEIVE